jgi:hypothetical protein
MARGRGLLLRVVIGLAAVIGIAVVALVWFAGSLVQTEQTDATRASAAFTAVRAQFAGASPAFEIRGDRLVVLRPGSSPESDVSAFHMLVWTPSDGTLSRVRLPFAAAVVATEPIPLEALIGVANQGIGAIAAAQRRGDELDIRLSDLRAYGRTLLFDGTTADGRQVVMWNE